MLSDGRGIDHVGIAVRDLEAARRAYETFGFNVPPGGKHPGGTQNAFPFFEDGTYLELITFYDRQKGLGLVLAEFLDKHEGAIILGLDVSSAKQAASFLRGRGFDVSGPQGGSIMLEGMAEPPPDMWWIVEFNSGIKARDFPGSPIFLVEYEKTQSEKHYREFSNGGRLRHPNTAIGIRSVWIAVNNAAKEATVLEKAGLRFSEGKSINNIGGDALRADAGRGAIELVQPVDPKGAVASFLAARGESILGVSIEVKNLQTVRDLIEKATKGEFATYDAAHGKSILIAPSLTHGIWLEMFQK
jgi:catechol 2,3-dioxygenase-like lactoylglutathione lyase family enzyme